MSVNFVPMKFVGGGQLLFTENFIFYSLLTFLENPGHQRDWGRGIKKMN